MYKSILVFLRPLVIGIAAFQLAASCSSEQPPAPSPHSGQSNSGAGSKGVVEGGEAEMVFEGPGALLAKQVGEWKIAGAPRYFGPDNLYDLIDGGAEIYVEFGLVKMVTADYKAPDKPTQTITVEVYDMKTPDGAFGRTARFLEGLADPSTAGAGLPAELRDLGILGEGDLVFWKGKHMAHLTLLEEDPAADIAAIAAAGKQVLPLFATDLAARMDGPISLPAVFARFPAEGRLARSEAWHPADVLAIEGLGPGYSVRYSTGEASWTAFTTERFVDEKAAESAWKSVKSAEAEGRRVALKLAGERVVGLVQEGEPRLDDSAAEKFAESLEQGFSGQ